MLPKDFFFSQIYHTQLTNLNISKNINKKCTPIFHEIHVTCYIKF